MRLLRSLCLVGLLAGSVASAQVPGAGPSEPTSDRRRIDERIRTLQSEAQRLAGSARTLVDELRGLEVARDLRGAEAAKADAAVAEAQGLLAKTDGRLAALEQERIERLPGLQAQLVDLYKRGSLGHAQMLFSAADVRELGRASRALTAMVALNRKRIEAQRKTLADLQQERQRQQSASRELQQRLAEASRTRAAAQRAVTAHAARLAEIDARRDLNAQYVGELQVARETLLGQLDAGAADRAVTAVPLPPFKGALDWPSTGGIVGQFEQSANRLGGSAVRNGVEIAAPDGTAVHAVHGGTVAHADVFPGFGNLVIVDHGTNHFSLYGYLGSIAVRTGQTVATGMDLGAVGPSPAGPSALYFELRIDGRSVDPVQWLKPR